MNTTTMNTKICGLMMQWLGRQTCDQQVASSIPGRALPGYYLDLGWVTVWGRVNHLGM